MKDSELKKLISDAYDIEPSERQKQFIRKYRRRNLKLLDILLIQYKYMRFQFWAVLCFLICAVGYMIVFSDPESVKWIASFMPFPAILALTGLGKSERYKMSELEMTARLSEKFLKSVRLVLIGIAGLLSVGVVSPMFSILFKLPISIAILTSAFPYVVTTTACMILLRRWHAKENVVGCIAIAMCVCVVSIMLMNNLAAKISGLGERICIAALIVCVFIMAREVYLYLKESEELQWNLC